VQAVAPGDVRHFMREHAGQLFRPLDAVQQPGEDENPAPRHGEGIGFAPVDEEGAELVLPVLRREGGGDARHQLGDHRGARIVGFQDEDAGIVGDDLVRQLFLPGDGGAGHQLVGGHLHQQPDAGKNDRKRDQKRQRIFQAAVAFLLHPHFARLDAEMRLPQQEHVLQYPPVGRFDPPAGFGIVENQVAGVVLVERQACQRQLHGAGSIFKLKVVQGELDAAGLRRIVIAFQGGEPIIADQRRAHRAPSNKGAGSCQKIKTQLAQPSGEV